MIPQIIHYIWFGGKPYPKKIQHCIDSWKKYLPDYKFMLWNEDSFDVNICRFAKEAYENKKWAFVSDCARVVALVEYGGWYLDTDIEILRPLSSLESNRVVMGTDENGAITAMYGAEKGHPYWQSVLNIYKGLRFVKDDGSFNMAVVNTYLQEELQKYGYVQRNKYQELDNGIVIFPDDYFHVVSLERGTKHLTNNSYAIHWQTMLWTSNSSRILRYFRIHILKPILGENFLEYYCKFKSLFK